MKTKKGEIKMGYFSIRNQNNLFRHVQKLNAALRALFHKENKYQTRAKASARSTSQDTRNDKYTMSYAFASGRIN
jgi:hypothetical protein